MIEKEETEIYIPELCEIHGKKQGDLRSFEGNRPYRGQEVMYWVS